MKKFLQLITLLLFVSAAWAIPPEEMRFAQADLSKPLIEDKAYTAWLSKMAEQGPVDSGMEWVHHEQLAQLFYVAAKGNGWLPKGAEEEAVYKWAWLKVNNLRPGITSVEQFRQIVGKNGGLRLVTAADMKPAPAVAEAKATAPAVAQAAPASTSAPKPATAPAVAADVVKVQALAAQLSALQEKVGKGEASVRSLKGQIAAYEQQLRSVRSVNERVEKAVEELLSGLKALRNGVLTKEQMREISSNVDQQLNQLTARVDGLEGNLEEVSTYSTSALVGVGVLGFAMIGLWLWQRGSSKKIAAVQVQALESSTRVTGVESRAADLEERMLGLETRVHHPETGLTATNQLASEAKELAKVAVGCTFDESIVSADKLRALPLGERVELPVVSTASGHDLLLEVERTGESQVTIHGALRQKGQTAPLVIDSLEGVVGKIYRAEKRGCLTGLATLINTQRKVA